MAIHQKVLMDYCTETIMATAHSDVTYIGMCHVTLLDVINDVLRTAMVSASVVSANRKYPSTSIDGKKQTRKMIKYSGTKA